MKNTLELLDKTAEHCDFLNTCHYIQAESNSSQRIRYGLPSLIINLVVGSVLVADLSKEVPNAMKWGTALLALISSFLVGIQTFYGFDQAERGHRDLGNKFNRISRLLAILKAGYLDKTIDDTNFSSRFEQIMKEYETVCMENEKFPPSREAAKKLQAQLEAEAKKALSAQPVMGSPNTSSPTPQSQPADQPKQS